ncbi:MAG: PQQ-binding-like beta-propeller repeat protein [Candidatus Dormibacteraceae bacterium]
MSKSGGQIDQGRWMPPPRPLGGVSTTGVLPNMASEATSAPPLTASAPPPAAPAPPRSTPFPPAPTPTTPPRHGEPPPHLSSAPPWQGKMAGEEAHPQDIPSSFGPMPSPNRSAKPLDQPWVTHREANPRLRRRLAIGLLAGLLLIAVLGVLPKFGILQSLLLPLTGGNLLSGKVDWQYTVPAASHQVVDQVALGSWASDGVVVFADRNRLVALDQKRGQVRWQTSPPGGPSGSPGSNYFCGMSTTTQQGMGAITFGQESSNATGSPQIKCTGLSLVDLHTGHLRWLATTLQDPNAAPATAHPELAGQTVAVAVDGNLAGVDVATGNQLWFHPKAAPDLKNGACQATDMLTKSTGIVVLYSCGAQGGEILQLDSKGNPTASIDLPSQLVPESIVNGISLVAASPVVVAIPESSDGAGDGKYLALTPQGSIQSLPEQGDWGSLDMHTTVSANGADHRIYHTVVSDNTLVTTTTPTPVTSIRDTNRLVAFDLTSGRERWSKGLGATITGVPVSIDGDSVISLGTGTYDNPPQAFQMSTATGNVATLGSAYPRDLIYKPNISQLHWVNHHIYGVMLNALSASFSIYALS